MTDTATYSGRNGREAPMDLSRDSLLVLPNQREHWHTFNNGGASFEEAAQMILDARAVDGDCEDQGIGDLSSWAFGPSDDGHAAIAPIPLPGRDRQAPIVLRDQAFGQLCSLAGAPSQYIRKLPAKLQMACVNYGMRAIKDKSALLRKAGSQGRAIVSDRYAALDDALVLEVMGNTLHKAGLLNDVRVRAVATGPTTALRLTLPSDQVVVKSPVKGDIVEIGLDLLNGEIGNRAVNITPTTYRLICLNGMRSADRSEAHRLRHVGAPKRLEEAFRDAVPAAIASSRGLRDQMERAVDAMVDDLLDEFDSLSAFGLSQSDARDVARDVMAGRSLALPDKTDAWGDVLRGVEGVSVFDIANGVTHVAQSHGTDKRIELEEAGAKYMQRRVR